MSLVVRAFSAPKDGNADWEYEDAVAVSGMERPVPAEWTPVPTGDFTISVADGASAAVFAREWAGLLVDRFALDGYFPKANEEADACVLEQGKLWRKAVSREKLPWYAQEKLLQGSSATLLTVQFLVKPTVEGAKPSLPNYWRAAVVGDVCLFVIRGDILKYAFPITKSRHFSDRPQLLTTEPRKVAPKWVRYGADLQESDRMLFCTDALAAWFLTVWEKKRKPWQEFPETAAEFPIWIQEQRETGLLKNDDVTLVEVRSV